MDTLDTAENIFSVLTGWQGYGTFTPKALEIMRSLAGHCDRVVMKTERTAEAVAFEVHIGDSETIAYETDEDLMCIWVCVVPFKAYGASPSPEMTAAARDQQLIADRCAQLLTKA